MVTKLDAANHFTVRYSTHYTAYSRNKLGTQEVCASCVVDRHRYDADPNPNFLVDLDPDPDWHQNDASPHADPTPSFTHVGKSFIFYFFIIALPLILSSSSVSIV